MGALILTRSEGQAIMIGDDIVVTVLNVSKGQAKIMIKAPDEVEIWRDTIYERIKQEKKDAGTD